MQLKGADSMAVSGSALEMPWLVLGGALLYTEIHKQSRASIQKLSSGSGSFAYKVKSTAPYLNLATANLSHDQLDIPPKIMGGARKWKQYRQGVKICKLASIEAIHMHVSSKSDDA